MRPEASRPSIAEPPAAGPARATTTGTHGPLVVQRKPEVEPLPQTEPAGEEEAASPGEATLRAPSGVLRAPSAPHIGGLGALRRVASLSGPAPAPVAEPELRAADLQDELLTRAAARTRLPLNHGLQMPAAAVQPSPAEVAEAPRGQPAEPETVLRQVLPAQYPGWGTQYPESPDVGGERGTRRPPKPAGELPLSPVAPPLIQRKAATPVGPVSALPHPAGTVQRAEAEEESQPAAPAPPDLEQLARQVYPIIRRMLKVERERAFGR